MANIKNLIRANKSVLNIPFNLTKAAAKVLTKKNNFTIFDLDNKINLKYPTLELPSSIVKINKRKKLELSNFKNSSGFYKVENKFTSKENISLVKVKANKRKSELKQNWVIIDYEESHFGVDNYEINEIQVPLNSSNFNNNCDKDKDMNQVIDTLKKLYDQGQLNFVQGRILNSVKGGFSVGICGFVAFLPYTQLVDYKAIKNSNKINFETDLDFLCGSLLTFNVIKAQFNGDQPNIILSRNWLNTHSKNRNNKSKIKSGRNYKVSTIKHSKFINLIPLFNF